jgi:hypothetical protein
MHTLCQSRSNRFLFWWKKPKLLSFAWFGGCYVTPLVSFMKIAELLKESNEKNNGFFGFFTSTFLLNLSWS